MERKSPTRTKDSEVVSSTVGFDKVTDHRTVTITVRSEDGFPSDIIQNLAGSDSLGYSESEVYRRSGFAGMLTVAVSYHFLVVAPWVEESCSAVTC